MSGRTADDLLWNWARWCWSGETVGNMAPHIPYDDEARDKVLDSDARIVEEMHAALPWHERMVIIAEYPKKNVMFEGLDSKARCRVARVWIKERSGVELTDTQYRLYLGLFKDKVKRRFA